LRSEQVLAMPSFITRFARAAALPLALTFAGALMPAAASADDPLILVTSNYPPSIADVQDLIAEQAGFYKEEHLAVTEEYVANAAASFAACASGKADVCSSSFEPVIVGYAKGVRLKLFLAHHPIYDYTLAVLSDSPIRTPADFKGADIGETNAGSTTEVSTNATLMGAGLHRNDYSFTPIGVGPAALTAITQHKVDAVSFPMQELAMYEATTDVRFRQFPNPLLRDIQNSGVGATAQEIATKGDLLRRYTRAVVKAFIFVRVNPDASARLFIEGTHQKVTPALLASVKAEILALEPLYPAYNLADPRIGYLSARGLALYCKFFQDAGITPDLVPGASFVDDEFIAFANDFDKKAFIAKAKAWRFPN
jgi:NitT/TauT family transport system substrate-binding protein